MNKIKFNIVDILLALSVIMLVAVGGLYLNSKNKKSSTVNSLTPPGAPNYFGTPGQMPAPIAGQ